MANSNVTITFSKVDAPYSEARGAVKVEIDWTADDGDGSVPETAFDTTESLKLIGRSCVLGVTDPGTTAPTADYDIETLDGYGVDIFGAELKNRSASLSQQVKPKIGNAYGDRLVEGALTFKLSGNSVNSAVGKCALYFEQVH